LSTGGDSGSSFILHENQQRRGESERRGSGTAFVKERVVHATKMVVGKFEQRGVRKTRMKKVTAKMFFALAAVALAAPFFAFAVLAGLRAVELASDARQNLLLLALAALAAAFQVLNARGAGALLKARESSGVGRRAGARETTALHLGL
jgi:hypothetical protein